MFRCIGLFLLVVAACAMDRKRPRLDSIIQLRASIPRCSQSALSAILSYARDELPEGKVSRKDIIESRDLVVQESTPYGPLHHTVEMQTARAGAPLQVEVQSPFAMFWKLCRFSESFSNLVLRTIEHHEPTQEDPWGIILYSDEVTPGNQLKPMNSRKFQAFYWAMFEFGAAALSDEESWLEPLVLRSAVAKNIAGGVSGLFAQVLQLFLMPEGQEGHDMSQGMMVHLWSGEHKLIFAKFLYKLADEAALHAVWGCKGSSGLKPCLKCENVFNKKTVRGIVEADRSGWSVDDCCFDVSRLVPTTKQSILDIHKRLHSAKPHMSTDDFKSLQTNLGWNYVPNGVMLCAAVAHFIDPPKQTAFDWMHVFFVNGVFGVHVACFMLALSKFRHNKVTYSVLYEYAMQWVWPKRVKETGAEAFCPSRAASSWKDHRFKCTASEALSLIAVMANFVQNTLMQCTDGRERHGACFLLLVEVVELIEVCARSATAFVLLREALPKYLNMFKLLYGTGPIIEKFHMSLHLLQQVRDEAHRFAITGHRARRAKARKQSTLEEIPGLGPKRRRELLRYFGGHQEINKASESEIAKVTGISKKLAENIYEYLHNS